MIVQAIKYELALQTNQNKTRYAELKEIHINGFIDRMVANEKLDLKKNDQSQQTIRFLTQVNFIRSFCLYFCGYLVQFYK